MGKRNDEENKISISRNMVINCKADISKFGFNPGDYEKFLVSVKAMKDDGRTVLQCRNEQLEDYRNTYIKKNQQSISDAFILDKFKIMTSNEAGRQYETGSFCPRSFWDYILDYRLV